LSRRLFDLLRWPLESLFFSTFRQEKLVQEEFTDGRVRIFDGFPGGELLKGEG
jgi:hypothetical protein